ncbi:MAG: chemotaxis protein CheA [Oceanococcus sp.]
MDDEILSDFLIESEELISNLGQQIIDLEANPQDSDLLNAVFRCFHTVKGGAGFLELEALVKLCHVSEDLCNGLRNNSLSLDAEMVDALSAAVDHLQTQHAALCSGEEPPEAEPALLATLARLAAKKEAAKPVESAPKEAATQIDTDNLDDLDLDALLDQMHGVQAEKPLEEAKPQEAQAEAAEDKPADADEVESHAEVATKSAAKPAATKSDKPTVEASIRVETSRLDAVMNLVGELVLARNQLKSLSRHLAGDGPIEETVKVSARIDRVTAELQSAVMKIRMQAIRKVFARFPRIVRDLARTLSKDIQLVLKGEDTELDKNLVEALADPLIHLVRNSVDHGIETPEQRKAAGKPEQGTVTLSACQEGDDIVISIVDDGAGMDPNRLRAKAIERGILGHDEAARMDTADCCRIIFMPGFSTRDEVSDVSGRGVGMDVVKTRIDQLNGRIHIESELGVGTTMELRLPLTLAIMASLMVRAGQRIFSVPLSSVEDVLMFDAAQYSQVDGRRVYLLADEPIPVLLLGCWCDEYQELPETAHMVLLRSGTEHFGVVVDSVIGREEVVIKPLGPPLTDLAGFSGATVTGDGRVALILDPPGLLKTMQQLSAVF